MAEVTNGGVAAGAAVTVGAAARAAAGSPRPGASRRGAERPELFRAVVEAARAAVAVVYPDGSWTALGDTFTRGLGHPVDLPARARVLSLVHPHDRRAVLEAFRAALDGREPAQSIPVRVRTIQGTWIELATTVRSRVHDPDVGGVVYYGVEVGRARDAERALNETSAGLARLIETLTVGILLVDAAGRVVVTNRALLDLFDVPGPPHRYHGTDARALLRRMAGAMRAPDRVADRLDRLLVEPWTALDTDLMLVGGRVVEIDVVPVNAGGSGALLHAWDVTARANTQRSLEERNEALSALVAAKNEFVASVSHELRSPLTSVVTFSNLLAQPDWGELDDEQRQFIEVIQRNADRLLRLIEDLLLLSRLEARTLQFVPSRVILPDLVRAAVAERAPIAQAADVTLKAEVSGDSVMSCDELRVNQVLGNLIGNALKFTPPGGSVTVRCHPAADGWRLSVTDSGIGIPAEDLDRIFEAFHRASNVEKHSHPGTGLGLVISKAIVERHGGLMEITSELGRGTTVTVWLPQRRVGDREGDR
ncbi:sensor histidine kinase [Cryptosporangium aurantiacum]|uniref:histidine kinase n=1 Tax=Cryptosporangium aurantiacum TaxID=134849 RepID=A0A1M7RJL6_9ACTN|nr:ATP-binding protein [Cryptosporangium aurantiacum]SHN46341.1 PAS domain S-box-containing protein [Cryptosporangium aurantiacum]